MKPTPTSSSSSSPSACVYTMRLNMTASGRSPNISSTTRVFRPPSASKLPSMATILWRLYLVLFLIGLYIFITTPSLKFASSRSKSNLAQLSLPYQHHQTGHSGQHGHGDKRKYAYITLLCGDVMGEAAMVMVHSVKLSRTPHDVVVLTMNVSNQTMEGLLALGAKIEPIKEPVPYPFTITADRAAINKPCRYSKLLMWNMVKYHKLIYLDSDLLILKNIDELFERPQIAAAPDTLPPDKFNSGLMVVEPNRATFRDMLNKVMTTASPNVGDQGFLNSYFSNWYKQPAAHHLDYTYNALVRLSVSQGWKKFIQPNLKVLHFSGSTKPWNMMVDKQFPTTREFDDKWWAVYDEVYSILHRRALRSSRNTSSVSSPLLPANSSSTLSSSSTSAPSASNYSNSSVPSSSPSDVPPQLAPQCKRNFMAYTKPGRLVRNKVSVVMNCFDRFDLMVYFVKRYAGFEFVHKIYIVWGNTKVEPYKPSFFNVSKPVEILYSGIDSLNDRFKPIPSLETEGVLMCDDDIEVHPIALRVGFERWMEDKYRLVGFFPRAHYRDPKTKQLMYVLTPRQEYSIVLTKMFFMHGDFLRAYTCTIPQAIRDYVDEHKNCEDITMNFLVTQLSGLPPLLMEDPTKLDFGTFSGLSSRGSHDVSRSVCMNDIARILGYMSLRNTSEAVTYFERDKMVKVVRRRRLSTAAHMVFQPIFDSFEHSSSRQFLKTLSFAHALTTTEMAQVPSQAVNHHIMCIKGNNDKDLEDSSRNVFTLLDFASVPPDADHLSGHTFIVHSSVGFEGRFTLLHIVASLAVWRRSHGCFGPARLILFHDGMLTTQVSAWGGMMLRAVLGPGAAPPFAPRDGERPLCLENALVLRQRATYNLDECSPDALEIRRVVHSFCRDVVGPNMRARVLDDDSAQVRIAFVGDAVNWGRMEWFNYSVAEAWIQQECAYIGLMCQVALVPRGEFCTVKVLGLSRADIVIGPWADRAMDNLIFFRPGTAVLELHPAKTHDEEKKTAKAEAECLELTYEQMMMDVGMDALLSWVSKQLDVYVRRHGRVRDPVTEPTFLETCITRNIRF